MNQEAMSYSLEEVSKRWKVGRGKNEGLLKAQAELWGLHPKSELWKLPARHVAEYAIEDVRLAMDIFEKQYKELDKQGLVQVFDLESRLLPVLVKMRRRGVRVDFRRLQEIEDWSTAEEKKASDQVKYLSGVSVDVNKPDSVASTCRAAGIELPQKFTPGGRQCVDAEVLAGIDHPVVRAIERAKKMNKLRCTFAASIRRYQTNGRIHCSLNQIRYERDDGDLAGTGFGRLSSTNPNLQQQPGRDPEIGPYWRSIFVPEEGERWASCDYSGQEPRWIVHYAAWAKAVGSEDHRTSKLLENVVMTPIVQAYHENHKLDLHQMTADLAAIKRKEAKTIFLGLAYGMGGGKLCNSLGKDPLSVENPEEWKRRVAELRRRAEEDEWGGRNRDFSKTDFAGTEGQAIIDKFHQMVPFLKAVQSWAMKEADKHGKVRTVLDRLCKFQMEKRGLNKLGAISGHKALNRIVQGSSADQTKQALVMADEAGIPVNLQVHDEVTCSVADERVAHELARVMREAIPSVANYKEALEYYLEVKKTDREDLHELPKKCFIPCVVDVELGSSWGDSMAEAAKSRELLGFRW
jgi:DNA polymerase I-like protein with 3'-5' exonuclease and polymerase domains